MICEPVELIKISNFVIHIDDVPEAGCPYKYRVTPIHFNCVFGGIIVKSWIFLMCSYRIFTIITTGGQQNENKQKTDFTIHNLINK